MADNDAVVIERYFDAPAHLIWQMWTEPEHFQAWYGPTGASIPIARMDVRVGGTRSICMEVQAPQGPMRMWFSGEYLEVVPNERLVYTEFMSDEPGDVADVAEHPKTEVRVELEDVEGRTRMVLTHVGIPSDSPGAAGWAMALDKLDSYVASMT